MELLARTVQICDLMVVEIDGTATGKSGCISSRWSCWQGQCKFVLVNGSKEMECGGKERGFSIGSKCDATKLLDCTAQLQVSKLSHFSANRAISHAKYL